jgi:hypothetical protein
MLPASKVFTPPTTEECVGPFCIVTSARARVCHARTAESRTPNAEPQIDTAGN